MKQALYRELERISGCRRHFIAAVAIPLISLIFMATIFGNGRIENLPTGVADCSNTPASRSIIESAKASPVLEIKPQHIFSNEAQAREAMQRMEIYGYIVIPENFTEELHSGNVPTITCYYHYVLLAAGGEIQGAFVKALGGSSASLVAKSGDAAGITDAQKGAITLPTSGIFTSTYNSTLNYGIFLSYPFFFIFFQIFILVFTVYIIGTDMNREWLRSGNGSILKALGGKLLPYASIFFTQTLIANYVFFCLKGIPVQGNLLAANISSLLLVAATISLGAAIISIIPKVSIAISIASMIGALGATASGVTFPVENMYPAFRALCHLLPIRHFVLANQSFLNNGAGLAYSWVSYAALTATIAICLCATPLLKGSIMKDRGKPLPVMWGTALVMLGGTLGYGFLYGLMYHPNIVTEVPVAAIDNSRSHLSREYLRNLEATQGVTILAECTDIRQGGELMKSGRAKGLVIIPDGFAANSAQGIEAPFAVFETTTSFLYYLTIQKAVAATMQELNNTLRTNVVKNLPLQQQLIMAQTPSFTTRSVPIYNSNGGYGSYLLPIAIIVIFFQTLLLSGGILAGSHTIHPLKFLPMLAGGYFLLSFFLTGLLPRIFNLPHLANPVELALYMLLFTAASTAFTGAAGLLLKDSEEVMLYVPFFSVGLIFLSGTSFPMVQIPHFWQVAGYFFPTSPGIMGYIRLNSMGCTLQDIAPQLWILALQTLIYGAIFLLYARKIVNLRQHNP